MARRRAQTVLEVAVAKGGIRRGVRVTTFVAQWTIAQQQLGRQPSLEEVADWWGESYPTWYRRLREFREIFAPAEYPTAIAAAAIAEAGRRLDRDDVGAALADLGRLVVA